MQILIKKLLVKLFVTFLSHVAAGKKGYCLYFLLLTHICCIQGYIDIIDMKNEDRIGYHVLLFYDV